MGIRFAGGGALLIRPKDRELANRLRTRLLEFDRQHCVLHGIRRSAELEVFVAQLVESVRRIGFVLRIRERNIAPGRADPGAEIFDPLRAAIFHHRCGNLEEAFWLVFLFVHFGKSRKGGWGYAREVYGCLGASVWWDWPRVSRNPKDFELWMTLNHDLVRRDAVPGGFGNHRKYESLRHTGAVVASYVAWVAPPRTHMSILRGALRAANFDPGKAFDQLYRSMTVVRRFGRTARFEYLAMVGKLGLAPIAPSSTYLSGSTGPLTGARVLFGRPGTPRLTPRELDIHLANLQQALELDFQVLEDALCNWQKSPGVFKAFRG